MNSSAKSLHVKQGCGRDFIDKGVKDKGMTAPAVVPIGNPEVDQGRIPSLQKCPGCQPQVLHNQCSLLLSCPHKSGNSKYKSPSISRDVFAPLHVGLRGPRFLS